MFVLDLEWCSQPSSEESFGSQCAEKLYTNVSGFSAIFSRIGYGGASFDYVSFAIVMALLGLLPSPHITHTLFSFILMQPIVLSAMEEN